jgi:polyisoprenoid-binding protein YceI
MNIILYAALFQTEKKEKSTWVAVQENSKLQFSIDRVVLSAIHGEVNSFKVKVVSENNDFSNAEIEMTADVSSITTHNSKRDADLKSPNFFDQAKFPKIQFRSTVMQKTSEGNYVLNGTLTMHGVSRFIAVNAMLKEQKENSASFNISAKLNRFDYGIGKGTNSSLVSKDVSITGTIEFTKKEVESK